MTRMVRKQIYIEREQEAFLKRRAQQLGVSEAELVREAIARAASVPIGAVPDLRAWEEERSFIERARCLDAPQTGRTWTRDELYEERLQRFSD